MKTLLLYIIIFPLLSFASNQSSVGDFCNINFKPNFHYWAKQISNESFLKTDILNLQLSRYKKKLWKGISEKEVKESYENFISKNLNAIKTAKRPLQLKSNENLIGEYVSLHYLRNSTISGLKILDIKKKYKEELISRNQSKKGVKKSFVKMKILGIPLFELILGFGTLNEAIIQNPLLVGRNLFKENAQGLIADILDFSKEQKSEIETLGKNTGHTSSHGEMFLMSTHLETLLLLTRLVNFKGKHIVDLGSGYGWVMNYLNLKYQQELEISGLDLNSTRSNFVKKRFSKHHNVRQLECDILDIECLPKNADIFYAYDPIDSFEARLKMLMNFKTYAKREKRKITVILTEGWMKDDITELGRLYKKYPEFKLKYKFGSWEDISLARTKISNNEKFYKDNADDFHNIFNRYTLVYEVAP